MATQHGKRSTYNKGCRCEDCKGAEYSYQENRRQMKLAAAQAGQTGSVVPMRPTAVPPPDAGDGPGPVESGVLSELEGLEQAQTRPGLTQTALALARIMDNPRAVNQQAAAAAKLTDLLDKLRKGADTRRSRLAQVRAMTVTGVKTG